MDLQNKYAIISGGKRGIGKAIARVFAKEGINLAICSKNNEGLDELKEELLSINSNISILCKAVDVRKSNEVASFIQLVYEKFEKIHILVNNAGVIRHGNLETMTEEDWDLIIDTNLKGPFLMMKYTIPLMRKQNYGHIINISSGLGKKAIPTYGVHCASKFGLRGMSFAVKDELKHNNIDMTIINPSSVSTDIWEYIKGDYDHKKMVAPEEVASAVLFAAKNAQTCTVDELDISPKKGIMVEK